MPLFTTYPLPTTHLQHSPSLTKDYPFSQDLENVHPFTSDSVETSNSYDNVLSIAYWWYMGEQNFIK
jgi:hypothetical protein